MKSILKRWNDKEEQEIWSKALFVFDSSVLLNFYEFSEKSRQDIYTNIFPKLKGRLWITNQTEYEFIKNREKVINRTEELYNEIKQKHFPGKHLKVFKQQFEQLKERTGKDSRHPYFSPGALDSFEAGVSELFKLNETLEQELAKQISERLDAHKKEMEKDKLIGFFQVTDGYSYDTLMDIVREGVFRYQNKIPPGYADEKKKDIGIAKFGDLIIWKQILELAKLKKQPVLLVTDDLKEDWFITDRNDKNKLLSPREELIKEMQDIGGVDFWAYNTSLFLYKANQLLKMGISEAAIKEVREVTANKIKLVEKAVFEWAHKRFNADETIWGPDSWNSDSPADIIQIIDGIPFSIQIKYFPQRVRMKEIFEEIEEIKSIYAEESVFELHTVVLVTENAPMAGNIFRLMSQHLPGFQIISGYLNKEGAFIEHSENH